MSAFDPYPDPIVLAKDIKSMFTKTEHSCFVTDFICSNDIAARICWSFYQCPINLSRFLHINKTDSKLTGMWAGCYYWKCRMVISSTGCCSTTHQKKLKRVLITLYLPRNQFFFQFHMKRPGVAIRIMIWHKTDWDYFFFDDHWKQLNALHKPFLPPPITHCCNT